MNITEKTNLVAIGVDPGVKGASCTLRWKHDGSFDIEFSDPKRPFYGPLEGTIHVFIEQQMMLHGQANQSKIMFEFGRLVEFYELKYGSANLIRPVEWYRFYRAVRGQSYSQRKKDTAERMVSLFPHVKPMLYGPRGGLIDGRSDALAIAYYGFTSLL